MYGGRRVTERTSLTRPLDSPDYVEFASLLRTRKARIRQFQCCICATLIAIFTMTLIVAVSYSVSHNILDANLTAPSSPISSNLTGSLKLSFAPGSGSYTLYSSPAIAPASNSIPVLDGSAETSPPAKLTEEEYNQAIEAGHQAMKDRLFADAVAATSPLLSPSPESRHRYAVNTCASVKALSLAAVAELAATKKIESSRAMLAAPTAIGSFFDGGWWSLGVCKQLKTPTCLPSKYRTFDGSCNRRVQWGVSMTPFRRALPPSYADGVDAPRRALSGAELPSAREVSLKVHKPSPSTNPHFTVMLAVYGQFLDHDITATAISQGINGTSISCCPPAVGHPECFPVPVAAGDPVFDVTGRTCMDFVRSAPAPQCKLGPRQQLNQVTAFIDGSTVYGSDVDTARGLREFSGGRLRMQTTPDNRTLLPASTNPNDGCNREIERQRGRYCFAAGDARANENLHLTTMHLLWARQHNQIADQLAKINPSWDDDTLYEESRRIVGAQMQHITYQEFLPIVLGEQEINLRDLRPLKSGYRQWTDDPEDASTDPSIANNFASAAFRFAHTLLPGLMKMTDAQEGSSSYVELHRMLFNPYSLYTEGGVKSSVMSATQNVIQMTSTHVTSQLTNHLFEDPFANVSLPCGLDLVSLNIQRGRDHGLPGYTRWREYCGLGKTESFSDLEGHFDPEALHEISLLYESVHDVDLYTGALAELPKSGGIVGPVFSCLIADQFVRLQKGDRFWYEVANQPHSFTEEQLRELRKTSLAKVICDCSDGVTQTQAEVMRAIGPGNPMMSCEDIPAPSFAPWKQDKPPMLQASFVPVNWTALKTNINDTIKDVMTFINDTRASAALDTDWLAFKSYINSSFSDIRSRLSDLHPPKANKSIVGPVEKAIDCDNLLLRAAGPMDVYQDWITFKNDLLKSLNDSIGTMKGGPASVTKWINFKQSIIDQFADLKNQIASMKGDPTLSMNNETLDLKTSIPAIFDWKNYKDDIISSLDDTIMDIGSNMPPPGDPAWAAYGNDIKDRFSALHDKIDNQRPTAPTELATGEPPLSDWLTYKSEIIKTVNDAVQKIKDDMPPPGDPAWATYRDEIMKSFSAFKTTPSPLELATSGSYNLIPSCGKLKASPKSYNNVEMSALNSDWADFRSSINDSLTRMVQDIQKKKPTTIDPVAWAAFKQSTANDFAMLKTEIDNMKAEWLKETGKSEETPTLRAAGGTGKFDYTKFIKPAIPSDEWVSFKQQINDTVMNILNAANATDKIDFDELHEMFNKSFADLKTQIASLKDLIATSKPVWNNTATDWIAFQTQLNSTIQDLVDNLKKEDGITNENSLKTLFEARDKLSDLEAPTNVPVSPMEWMQYASNTSKTITDTLKSLKIRAADSAQSSSDSPKTFKDWLMVPCLASSFYVLILWR
nr:PREDICTED: uncharacterized protein LOC105664258 isoform X1 [Megachile rotundata]XP_012153485.1 PREDICTED: uncharacterized protein LOC105664258 isoform X1 [Megachile rotundata]XP_012153487.1 PREDICTED: uncharacterized protein LOC105664258 isoform X1 [Megachile rotundata]